MFVTEPPVKQIIFLLTFIAVLMVVLYRASQMRHKICLGISIVLAMTQIYASAVILSGPERITSPALWTLFEFCCFASILVLPGFAVFSMGFLSLFHVKIKDVEFVSAADHEAIRPREYSTVYRTESLYIFFPRYSNIDFVTGAMPPRSDNTITWCSSAAFHLRAFFDTDFTNIAGYYSSRGKFYESPEIDPESMAVTFYDGRFHFDYEDPRSVMIRAAEHGGCGFMQLRLLKDGKVVKDYEMLRTRCFRALAELNGELCIIDSCKMTKLDDFVSELLKIKVVNAVYMDTGPGWNYSWYRKPSGETVTLFRPKLPWTRNWLTFRE